MPYQYFHNECTEAHPMRCIVWVISHRLRQTFPYLFSFGSALAGIYFAPSKPMQDSSETRILLFCCQFRYPPLQSQVGSIDHVGRSFRDGCSALINRPPPTEYQENSRRYDTIHTQPDCGEQTYSMLNWKSIKAACPSRHVEHVSVDMCNRALHRETVHPIFGLGCAWSTAITKRNVWQSYRKLLLMTES